MILLSLQSSEELMVVVGGGAAGIYGAIRAKTLAPNLKVVVVEKGKALSKVYSLFVSLPFGNFFVGLDVLVHYPVLSDDSNVLAG